MIRHAADGVRDDYMLRLRRCLRGVSPDVAVEVEQEIAAHIEDALAAQGAVDEVAVAGVLERLGPPEDYARDWALYLMVDRGYRGWSVPHMVRSAASWGFGTLAGAVAVLGFGALYAASLWAIWWSVQMLTYELRLERYVREMARLGQDVDFSDPSLVSKGVAYAVAGAFGLGVVTVLIRWFIGQYVHRARPHAFGMEVGDGWTDRTSRRIVKVAVGGAALAGPLAVLKWTVWNDQALPALLAGGLLAGIGLLVLAPVIGLLWSAWAEGP